MSARSPSWAPAWPSVLGFKFFGALAEAGINIEMISTSEIRVSVTRAEDLDEAVRAVHTAFGLDSTEDAIVYGGTGRRGPTAPVEGSRPSRPLRHAPRRWPWPGRWRDLGDDAAMATPTRRRMGWEEVAAMF